MIKCPKCIPKHGTSLAVPKLHRTILLFCRQVLQIQQSRSNSASNSQVSKESRWIYSSVSHSNIALKPNHSSLQGQCPVPPLPMCSSPSTSGTIFSQAEYPETYTPLCLFPQPSLLQKCILSDNKFHNM